MIRGRGETSSLRVWFARFHTFFPVTSNKIFFAAELQFFFQILSLLPHRKLTTLRPTSNALRCTLFFRDFHFVYYYFPFYEIAQIRMQVGIDLHDFLLLILMIYTFEKVYFQDNHSLCLKLFLHNFICILRNRSKNCENIFLFLQVQV